MPVHDATTDRTGRVVVVGAGAAGLTAARSLAASGARVVVVDKARGVGGRMATRRLPGGGTADSGAQFLTAHDPAFAATVTSWEAAGVVAPWFRGAVGPTGTDGTGGHVRWRGVPAMTGVAQHLARGLDVRPGCPVSALHREGTTWRVATGRGALQADAVVLTAPVPQALALLDASGITLAPGDADALGALRYDPCLAALVPLRGPAGLPAPGAVAPDDGPLTWIADNAGKGVSATPVVTLHAGPAASGDRFEEPAAAVVAELWAAAGLDADPVLADAHLHRWRYARPTTGHHDPCLVVDLPAPLVVAGDAFVAGRVEGAVASGAASAVAVAERLAG